MRKLANIVQSRVTNGYKGLKSIPCGSNGADIIVCQFKIHCEKSLKIQR